MISTRRLLGGLLTGTLLGLASIAAADEATESPAQMGQLLTPVRVGPSYLYPDPATTPGLVNPDVTQSNIRQTVCVRGWTATVRPPIAYTNQLKRQQLAASRATDQNPAHFEEDHLISLELGGHPRDPRNLWPEPWGSPDQPLTSQGPFPSHLIGAKTKDRVENILHREVCAGRMTLHEAQGIIATDWFKYYLQEIRP